MKLSFKNISLKKQNRHNSKIGHPVAWSVSYPTPDFDTGHDLKVVRSVRTLLEILSLPLYPSHHTGTLSPIFFFFKQKILNIFHHQMMIEL